MTLDLSKRYTSIISVGSQDGSLKIGDLVVREGRIYRVEAVGDDTQLVDITDRTVSLAELARCCANGEEGLIRGWVKAGMPVMKVKDHLLFDVDMVDAWLAERGFTVRDPSQPVPPTAEPGAVQDAVPGGLLAEPAGRYGLRSRKMSAPSDQPQAAPDTPGPPRTDLDDLVSVSTIVERYHLPSRTTVLRWVQRGLPSQIMAGMRVFRIADVEAWLLFWGYDPEVLKADGGLVRARLRSRFRRARAAHHALTRHQEAQLSEEQKEQERARRDAALRKRRRRLGGRRFMRRSDVE